MTETKRFAAGDNPADYNVPQVVEFLKGDDVTPDEYDRVMQAERERAGGGRVGILNMTGDEVAPVAPDAPDTLPKAEVSDLPPSVVDPDAEKPDDSDPDADSTSPVTPAQAIDETMRRLAVRKGRNYEDVLSTRGTRPHGE